MLREVSPYDSYFKHTVDLMRQQGGIDIKMVIRTDGSPDPRRYDVSTAPEISVLLPGSGPLDPIANRDIVLHAYGGDIKRITETHCAYDFLYYVLLFPLGWLAYCYRS